MSGSPTRVKTWLAFAAVYLIWGSTYLAIREAVHTMPPFLMAGSRFLIAGALMAAWAGFKREPSATRGEIGQALVVALFLLVGGNGLVSWSEQRMPSGLTALLIATEPMWLACLLMLGRKGARPTAATVAAIVLGLAGVAILAIHGKEAGTEVNPVGVGVLLLATFSWAAGSIYMSRVPAPRSVLRQAAWQMSGGGAIMFAIGTLRGEFRQVRPESISLNSGLAYAYLVVFGSIVAFQAYTYLLRVTTPTKASTYAYVNPVVAVFLGWLIGGEAIGTRELLAAVVIVTAVVIVASSGAASKGAARTENLPAMADDEAVISLGEPEGTPAGAQ